MLVLVLHGCAVRIMHVRSAYGLRMMMLVSADVSTRGVFMMHRHCAKYMSVRATAGTVHGRSKALHRKGKSKQPQQKDP